MAGGGGRDDDGAAELLALLDGKPATYARDASERLERPVPVAAVKAIFDGRPVDDKLLRALAPDAARATGRRAPTDPEAAFSIARDGGRTLLVVGGRVQADGPEALYDDLLAAARARFARAPR